MWKLSEFDCNEFKQEIEENGFTFFSKKRNRIYGFYPNSFPHYREIPFEDLEVDDYITVRAFFAVGQGEKRRIDSGFIDLRIEHIENENEIWGVVMTELPKEFALSGGSSINLSLDEILTFRGYEPEIVW